MSTVHMVLHIDGLTNRNLPPMRERPMYAYAYPFGFRWRIGAVVPRVIVPIRETRDMVGFKVHFLQEKEVHAFFVHIKEHL